MPRDERGTKRQLAGVGTSIAGAGGIWHGLDQIERGNRSKRQRDVQLADAKAADSRRAQASAHQNGLGSLEANHEARNHRLTASHYHRRALTHNRLGTTTAALGVAGTLGAAGLSWSGQNAQQKHNAKQGVLAAHQKLTKRDKSNQRRFVEGAGTGAVGLGAAGGGGALMRQGNQHRAKATIEGDTVVRLSDSARAAFRAKDQRVGNLRMGVMDRAFESWEHHTKHANNKGRLGRGLALAGVGAMGAGAIHALPRSPKPQKETASKADWKTIEQRQGRQRRLRHSQEYGLTAAGIGGGLALAAVRAKPTAFREAREIVRPLSPKYGKFNAGGQSIKVKVPLKTRSRAVRSLAQARPHGSVVLGGGLIAATGLGVAGTARGLEVWHQHKINDRRRRNMALQSSRGRVQKTYGGYSAIGKRYVEVSKGPVMVPTPVISAAEKFKGVLNGAKDAAQAGFAGANKPAQIAGQGTLNLGLQKPGVVNSVAGAVGNAAGKATATPMRTAATAGTIGATAGMAASPRQKMQKADNDGNFYRVPVRAGNPRYYDPEDRRQRRLGTAAGGLTVAGGVSGYSGTRRLVRASNKIKQAKGVRVIPVHGKGLAGVGIGGAAVTAGLQIYRRGNDPRNKRWT